MGCEIASNHDLFQYWKRSLIPLGTPQLTCGWTRNWTQEFSIFHNKINRLVILAGEGNAARNFTIASANLLRGCLKKA